MKLKLVSLCVLLVASLFAAPMKIVESAIPVAPEAVARPFYGWVNGVFVVAGGSTHDGTTKRYSDTISVYSPETKTWTVLEKKLAEGVAEGASITIDVGTELKKDVRLLCVSGATATGATSKVFLLDQNGQQEVLPDFPHGTLTMSAATAWNKGVAFVGGKLNNQATNRVFTLTPKKTSTEAGSTIRWTWDELPALPAAARSQAVAATQNGDQKSKVLLVFGGTSPDGNNKETALYDGWAYAKNLDGQWSWKAVDNAPCATIGATFLPIGDQHVILVGGYNGKVWDDANRMDPLAWAACVANPDYDFAWNRVIYTYHAVTGKWTSYGELAEGTLPRCGAAAGIYTPKGSSSPAVFLVGGEVRPAKRTGDALTMTFERQGWRFSSVSWVVIVLFFLAMAGMGVYFALKPKSADDYFRGGGRVPWYVAGMSIYATMLSSITFISVPTQVYIGDWRYFPMVLCILAMAPIAIYFYLPFFCRLKITSAYEYLEHRFNLGVRLFGATVFNIFMVCRVAVVTLLPAIALTAVTGMPIWVAIVLCGVATIIYCFFGGVEAVIWSDFVQGLILLGGAIVVMVSLVMSSGGVGEFVEVASSANKFKMWDFRFIFSEPVFWVILIMGVVSNLNSYTADQCVVQRYITTPDEKAARRSIWFNGVLSVISSVIFYLIGTALYTHYVKHPEIMDITMPKSDSVFPIFMAIELHPIIAGLVVASIFAATISTLSTNLNSSATSLVTDFVARFKKDMSSEAQVKCGSWCVVIVGVIGVVAALILSVVPTRSLFDTFQNFIGTLTGGLSALFFIGIFMPRVGGAAAIIALVVNYIVSLGIKYVVPTEHLHAFTYGGIALVVCFVVAYVASFIFPNAKDNKGLTFATRPASKE